MISPAVSIHLDEDTGRWLADPADPLSAAVAEAWNADAEPAPAATCGAAALLRYHRDPETAEALGIDIYFWRNAR
jgi:hypothetical protein